MPGSSGSRPMINHIEGVTTLEPCRGWGLLGPSLQYSWRRANQHSGRASACGGGTCSGGISIRVQRRRKSTLAVGL